MGTCRQCDRELDPAWKFCIYCGAPVAGVASIPAAIRPEPVETPPARRFDPHRIAAVAVAIAGAALIVTLLVVLLQPHG